MTIRRSVRLLCDRCGATSADAQNAAALRSQASGWQRLSEPGRIGPATMIDLCPDCVRRAVPEDGVRAGRIAVAKETDPSPPALHVTLDGRLSVCGRPRGVVLHPDTVVAAHVAPGWGRCHLPGCDGWWHYTPAPPSTRRP